MRRRFFRLGAGAVVVGVALAGCGSSKPSTPPLSAAKKTTTFPSYMIQSPPGYAVSKDPTSEGAVNGPFTPAAFDKTAGRTGFSAELGLVRGYDVAYDKSSDTVESTLFTFSTPAQAVQFNAQVGPSGVQDDAPTKSTLPGVPAVSVLTGTKKDDGFYYVYAIAAKGVTAMIVEFETEKQPASPPAVLLSAARQQYNLMPAS